MSEWTREDAQRVAMNLVVATSEQELLHRLAAVGDLE
jgi:hypothetical protein